MVTVFGGACDPTLPFPLLLDSDAAAPVTVLQGAVGTAPLWLAAAPLPLLLPRPMEIVGRGPDPDAAAATEELSENGTSPPPVVEFEDPASAVGAVAAPPMVFLLCH
jgi:hypothetical protein